MQNSRLWPHNGLNGAVYFTADVCAHRVPPLEEAAMAAMQTIVTNDSREPMAER
jgi:hypothetical protein